MNVAHRMLGVFLWLAVSYCLPCQGQQYPYFAPGGALNCTPPCTSQNVNLAAGSPIQNILPAGNLPNVAANSLLGNNTASAASQTSLNVPTVMNMLSATGFVSFVATANVATLSGAQTITTNANFRQLGDGGAPAGTGGGGGIVTSVTVPAGYVILLVNQTTHSQNGPWLVNSGAWTRPINFPSGFNISAGCVFEILDGFTGQRWSLNTTGYQNTAVVVDTTSMDWTLSSDLAATNKPGAVLAAVNNVAEYPVTSYALNLAPPPHATFDCAQFADTLGDIADYPDNSGTTFGTCELQDGTTGHLVGYNQGTGQPTLTCTGVSCSAGTIDTNAGDNRGLATAVTIPAAGTLTITFNAAYNWKPAAHLQAAASLVTQPYISSRTLSGATTTAVTWTFPSGITNAEVDWIVW